MKLSANFSRLLEGFFTDRLMRQCDASPHTIATYRDTFCLLLRFAEQRLKKPPSALTLADLDAPFLSTFLDHLEKSRGNTIRSCNCRLAALRSFFQYAAFHELDHSALIQRVLAMPSKRYDRTEVEFLTHQEIDALLAVPDLSSWAGRRDRTLLHLAVQTGLRVSELVGLRWEDILLSNGAHVHCRGKGRKERCTPLRKDVIQELGNWYRELKVQPRDPVFPSMRGGPLGPDGVQHLLAKHLATAQKQCSSLRGKRVSPHVLRHSAAMELLLAGVDQAVIALWLGHERPDTTQIYIHANLALKEQALATTTPPNVPRSRYKPSDELLAFLKNL